MAVEVPLILPRRVAIRILGEAQTAQPRRIAGLVASDDSGPAAFFAIRNAAPKPEATIVYSADELNNARAAMRGRGMTLWAYVTSHPTAAAVPLMQDFMDSPYKDAVHLVVSLTIKGVLEMRAWQLRAAEPRERVLKIRD